MHIFKAGTHTTAAGATLSFSEADLAACAKAYDPKVHEAPITVGHPKDDAPAYGWVKSLSAEGFDLSAERHQVDPAFAELCREGKFKKVSASFYRPDSPSNPVPGVWYLRHVAMLGAQPPAVKGLRAVDFSDTDEGVVEFGEVDFSDYALTSIARILRRVREFFVDKHGLETADKVLPDWEIENVAEIGRDRDQPKPSIGFNEQTHQQQESTVPAQNSEPTDREKELQRQLDQANANLAQRDQAAAASALAARQADAAAFAESLITSNQLLPKDKSAVVAVLCAVEGETAVEFAEGDKQLPAGPALRELLKTLPKHKLNGEHIARDGTGAGSNDDAEDIARRAVEFRETEEKAGRYVSTAEAVTHVMKQG